MKCFRSTAELDSTFAQSVQDGSDVVFIVNPTSAAGATGSRWPAILKCVEAHFANFEVLTTKGPRDATSLARSAILRGFRLIVAVGGDGTLSEVINGFFDEASKTYSSAALGYIPCGTGGDFRRSLKWDKDIDKAIQRLRKRELTTIDIGNVSFVDKGLVHKQHFMNISSCGVSGLSVQIANNSSKMLGGLMTFYVASVRGMLQYKKLNLRVKFDDGAWEELDEVNCIAVCNGSYFGGGMKVAPNAEINDGFFDVTIWSNYNLLDFITKSSAMYDGTHVQNIKTRTMRCKRIEVDYQASRNDDCVIELDGEAPGSIPATWTVIPSAINLVV